MVHSAGPDNVTIRPDHGYGFTEVPRALLVAAQKELAMRAWVIGGGLDTPTACDKLLAMWLSDCSALTPER